MPLLPLTGMMARRIAPAASVPGGLRLEVPEDDAGCCDAIDVNSAAYGMDLNASKPAFGRGSFWADHLLVVGRAGRRSGDQRRGHARGWPPLRRARRHAAGSPEEGVRGGGHAARVERRRREVRRTDRRFSMRATLGGRSTRAWDTRRWLRTRASSTSDFSRDTEGER
jgi:hypothetical protein